MSLLIAIAGALGALAPIIMEVLGGRAERAAARKEEAREAIAINERGVASHDPSELAAAASRINGL